MHFIYIFNTFLFIYLSFDSTMVKPIEPSEPMTWRSRRFNIHSGL